MLCRSLTSSYFLHFDAEEEYTYSFPIHRETIVLLLQPSSKKQQKRDRVLCPQKAISIAIKTRVKMYDGYCLRKEHLLWDISYHASAGRELTGQWELALEVPRRPRRPFLEKVSKTFRTRRAICQIYLPCACLRKPFFCYVLEITKCKMIVKCYDLKPLCY